MPRCLSRILCLFALAACAPLAHAQIYRCIGAHGEPVFSGEPCGTPAPPPGQHVVASALGGVCAGSPQSLRRALAGAFATHDVNRLAGLILWRGMDQASARDALRSFAAWLRQPLTGIALEYGMQPPPPDAGPSAGVPAGASSVVAQPPSGFEISTGGVDGGIRDFGITEFGGCWWLTF